jgi:hypothetical protein
LVAHIRSFGVFFLLLAWGLESADLFSCFLLLLNLQKGEQVLEFVMCSTQPVRKCQDSARVNDSMVDSTYHGLFFWSLPIMDSWSRLERDADEKQAHHSIIVVGLICGLRSSSLAHQPAIKTESPATYSMGALPTVLRTPWRCLGLPRRRLGSSGRIKIWCSTAVPTLPADLVSMLAMWRLDGRLVHVGTYVTRFGKRGSDARLPQMGTSV